MSKDHKDVFVTTRHRVRTGGGGGSDDGIGVFVGVVGLIIMLIIIAEIFN